MRRTGFNIKTTYFVGDTRFLLIERGYVFERAYVFVMTGGSLDFRGDHFSGLNEDPTRGADLLDMEEAEKGWDIAFVEL